MLFSDCISITLGREGKAATHAGGVSHASILPVNQTRARADPDEVSSTHTKLRKRLTTTRTFTLYDQASHLSINFLACFLLSDRLSG